MDFFRLKNKTFWLWLEIGHDIAQKEMLNILLPPDATMCDFHDFSLARTFFFSLSIICNVFLYEF